MKDFSSVLVGRFGDLFSVFLNDPIHIRPLGDWWRSRRKLLTPAFHFSILNSFVEVMNEQSRVLCGSIGETCQSFPEGKADIDVYPMITRCSLDIMCGTTTSKL